MTGAKLNAGCKESTVTSDSPNHLQLDELEPYTEYKVVVAAHLGSLNISKEEEVVGRTGPLQHVSWSVGLDGLLTVVWRERVADFRGKDPVQVRQAFSSHHQLIFGFAFDNILEYSLNSTKTTRNTETAMLSGIGCRLPPFLTSRRQFRVSLAF